MVVWYSMWCWRSINVHVHSFIFWPVLKYCNNQGITFLLILILLKTNYVTQKYCYFKLIHDWVYSWLIKWNVDLDLYNRICIIGLLAKFFFLFEVVCSKFGDDIESRARNIFMHLSSTALICEHLRNNEFLNTLGLCFTEIVN